MFEPLMISNTELQELKQKLADPVLMRYFKNQAMQTVQDIARATPKEGQSLEDFYRNVRQEQGYLECLETLYNMGASASETKVNPT